MTPVTGEHFRPDRPKGDGTPTVRERNIDVVESERRVRRGTAIVRSWRFVCVVMAEDHAERQLRGNALVPSVAVV